MEQHRNTNDMDNYARFYMAFNQMPIMGDREEAKAAIVAGYTGGRTTSLREVTAEEYIGICKSMEATLQKRADAFIRQRKAARSAALHQLQLYGIDTTDWTKVNAFCLQPRIAGKAFRELRIEELEALTRKMRAINKKTKDR